MPVAAQLVVTGFVEPDGVRSYLKCMDVYVCPSVRETYGISVAQALSMALPVVHFGVDGLQVGSAVHPPSPNGIPHVCLLGCLVASPHAPATSALGNMQHQLRETRTGCLAVPPPLAWWTAALPDLRPRGVTQDFLQDGVNSVVVKSWDPHELAAKLTGLADSSS